MRKNKFMRAASGLLVAVLLTTCVISGTFAKYVTTGTGEDSARVAKFGVVITTNGTTFAKQYPIKDTNAAVGAQSVISSDDTNVVAPGTSGNLVNANISGTPEVAVHVEYTPTLDFGSNEWKDEDGNEYCPIVFTVGDTTYGMTGMKDSAGNIVTNESTTISGLKNAVETAIKAYSADYAPNKDLSTISKQDDVKVSWNWAYDNSEENDVKDTFLGKQAAEGKASTVKLTIKTTVTQID